MRKTWVTGSIVAVHCVVVGGLLLTQGCGTTPPPQPPEKPNVPVVMPPSVEPTPPPVVVAPPVVPPPVEQTKVYTVKAGDSLSLIGKRFNVSVRDIMKLNKISHADKIRVGQKITLPGYVDLNAAAPAATHKTKPSAAKNGKGHAVAGKGDYVVKAGDSLAKIAKAHGTTVKALREANGLTSDKIRVGQKLVLAKGAGKPEAAPAPAETTPTEGQPVVEPVPAPVPTEGAAVTPTTSKDVLHVVEPNQDINSIAMMYGVRVEDVMKLNNLTAPEVKVGQTLKIPPPVE